MSMNENILRQERLSVVLDDYDASPSHQQALDEVLKDVNDVYAIRRYQMIGDVMRNELPEQVSSILATNIKSQIALEEEIQGASNSPVKTNNSNSRHWLQSLFKPLVGLAIAASVAVVSVSLWQTLELNQQSGAESDQLATITEQKVKRFTAMKANTSAVTVSGKLGQGTKWKLKRNTPAIQQKLNGYLVNHTEYSNSIQGLIKQANVAGFDAHK